MANHLHAVCACVQKTHRRRGLARTGEGAELSRAPVPVRDSTKSVGAHEGKTSRNTLDYRDKGVYFCLEGEVNVTIFSRPSGEANVKKKVGKSR